MDTRSHQEMNDRRVGLEKAEEIACDIGSAIMAFVHLV